jgi:hypothetical protein
MDCRIRKTLKSISARKPVGLISLSLLVVMNAGCSGSEKNRGALQVPNHFNLGYNALDLEYREGSRHKTLTVAVWYPTTEPPQNYTYGGPTRGKVALDAKPFFQQGPYPLLIFSHRYGGSGLGSVFLTEPLTA